MVSVSDIYGTVFERGAAILLARLVHANEDLVDAAEIASINYTISEASSCSLNSWIPVEGHIDVPLSISSVLHGVLQTDAAWTVDSEGYNFRHDLDVSESAAFANAGRTYQVRYELQPTVGQVIVFRFQIRAI